MLTNDWNNLLDDNDEDLAIRQQRKLRAGLAAGTIMIGSIALMAPFVISKSSLPYMGTPKHKLKQALDYALSLHRQPRASRSDTQAIASVSPTTHKQESLTLVDLGSGDGEAVRQAVLAGYDRAIGIELNYTLYLISQLRRLFFWTSHERRHSSFYCRDFFSYNLSHATTVMIFGIPPLMEPLSRKLAEELRRGTTILSYRFAVPVKEESNDSAGLLAATTVYDKQEMRIYQTTTDNKSTIRS
jgi:hypothetical protein